MTGMAKMADHEWWCKALYPSRDPSKCDCPGRAARHATRSCVDGDVPGEDCDCGDSCTYCPIPDGQHWRTCPVAYPLDQTDERKACCTSTEDNGVCVCED